MPLLDVRSLPTPATAVSNTFPHPVPQRVAQKRRRKPIEFESIYPEKSEPEAATHARALLALMSEWCTPGRYIKKSELERMYGELCKAEGWQPRNWIAIARRLGKMTEKRTGKCNGKKCVGYRVPRTQSL
jgi:hypothetical protein